MTELHMPIVRPVPIKTVGLPWYKQTTAFFKTRRWELVEPFELWCSKLDKWIYIPAPFVFNFASIPRLFWPVASPTDLLLLGSVPHDFGYEYGGLFVRSVNGEVEFVEMSRGELDDLLESITVQYNEMKPMAAVAWAMVRSFGWISWRNQRNVREDYPGLF